MELFGAMNDVRADVARPAEPPNGGSPGGCARFNRPDLAFVLPSGLLAGRDFGVTSENVAQPPRDWRATFGWQVHIASKHQIFNFTTKTIFHTISQLVRFVTLSSSMVRGIHLFTGLAGAIERASCEM